MRMALVVLCSCTLTLTFPFGGVRAYYVIHHFWVFWLHIFRLGACFSLLLIALSIIRCHYRISPFLGASVSKCIVFILIQAPEFNHFCQNANAAVDFQNACVVVLFHICHKGSTGCIHHAPHDKRAGQTHTSKNRESGLFTLGHGSKIEI
jgi:hypothetical protein